jgi:ATP-dependent Clp protease ATP-binding subunit ClpC
MVSAQEEARLLNHTFLGTEHILLGLIQEGEGLAATALESLGIFLETVRERVIEIPESREGEDPDAIISPPLTRRAKTVLELALREAIQLGENYISTEHLLLGLVDEGEGVAVQVLQSLGADLPRVRLSVISLLSPPSTLERQSGIHSNVGGPFCSRCRAPLADVLRYRELSAQGQKKSEKMALRIAYCDRCGTSLGVGSIRESDP